MAERENIRSRLKKHQLTQVWLINQLGLRGIVTDLLGTTKSIASMMTAVTTTQSQACVESCSMNCFLCWVRIILFLMRLTW